VAPRFLSSGAVIGARLEREGGSSVRAVATPLVDTVRPLPIAEVGTIHSDPSTPQPVSCGGAVLSDWDDAASPGPGRSGVSRLVS
jgi:hypothetical protein